MIYKDLILKETLTGGNSIDVIKYVNNIKFNYLKGDDIYFEFLDNTFNNNIYKGFLNQKRKELDTEINISNYYRKGTTTAVFKIKDSENNKYIIKIKEHNKLTDTYLKLFKNKYNSDKQLYSSNIPNIFYYGKVSKDYDEPIYVYNITHIYNTNFNILTFDAKKMFLFNLLKNLILLNRNNKYIKDLKMENIAYTPDLEPIYIDYDEQTISDIFSTNIYGETYFPFYIMNEMNTKTNKKCLDNLYQQDKLSVIGLCDIIFKLFFVNTSSIMLYRGNIYGLIENNIRDYYFKSTQNVSNVDILKNFISLITPQYDDDIFNDKLKHILLNDTQGLLHPNYENIYTYKQINEILFPEPDTPPTEKVNEDEKEYREDIEPVSLFKGGVKYKISYKN
jgi:hypothetical protein